MSYLSTWWYRSPLFWSIFFLDRWTKLAAMSFLESHSISINKYLSFQLSLNRGIAWSLFYSDSDWVYIIISCATLVLLAVLAKYTVDRQKEGYAVEGETLLLAGGLANFIDRFWYAGVVDFIKISYNGWVFPIFNCADVAITAGGCLILYQFFFDHEAY